MLTQLCWQPCSCSMHMSTPERQKGRQSSPRAGWMHRDPSSGMCHVPAAEVTGTTHMAPALPAPVLTH